MTKEEIKIIADSMVESSKIGTENSLEFIKQGLKAYKELEIPIVSADGQYCYGVRIPYKQDKAIQSFVDFMLNFIDESIKMLEKKGKSE